MGVWGLRPQPDAARLALRIFRYSDKGACGSPATLPRSVEDTRKDHGERRVRVLALLDQRLHFAIVTLRADATHVISLRKANRTEVKWYEQATGRSVLAPG